jgi:hypothetical protein
MVIKRRIVAPVPPPPGHRAGNSSPTTIAEIEEQLNLTDELMRLPHIGPLIASERPIVASWPAKAPARVGTSQNPTTAAPSPQTAPLAQLPAQLLAMIYERQRMLDRIADPDMETLVAMHFGVVEECCQKLYKHFPTYRAVYRGMQDSIAALHHNFGTMLADIDTLSNAINTGKQRNQQMSEETKAVQRSVESELGALRSQCHDNTANQEQIRVLSTQNTDLFEQLKKMKRKVTESDEISQHVSSRNIVLTVNQGRLEHEVERLNRTVEAIREHHDNDLKLLEHRASAIQAMETKIESLNARLEVTETNLRKSNADNRTVIDANRALTEMNSRLQLQLQQALDASMKGVSAASSPTSRAVSPRIASRGKRLDGGEPTTPRPDWVMATMLIQNHEDQLAVQLKALPTSREKLRLLSQAFVSVKQRLRAAEADVVVVAQRAAAASLVPQPPQATTPQQAPLTIPSGTSRRASVAKLHFAPIIRRRILEVFSTASHFADDSTDGKGISFLHEFLNVPVLEVPRLDISPQEVSTICIRLFHEGLLGKLIALLDRTTSTLSPSARSDRTTPLFSATPHLNTVGSELANMLLKREESNSDMASQRIIAPSSRASFYMVLISAAEEFIVEPLFKNCGLDALPLPRGVTQMEVAVRSLIRSAQDQETTDAYGRLLLHSLADTIAPTTFLHFRKEIEKLRNYMIQSKDLYITGRCDPLTFTMAVKKVWPYCGELQLDIIQRLAKEELQMAVGHNRSGASAQPTSQGSSTFVPPAGLERNNIFGGPMDTGMEAAMPSSAATAALGARGELGSIFRAPSLVVHSEKLMLYNYLDALNTPTSAMHQFLLHTLITNVISSQAAVVDMLRGLAERTARPSEAVATGAIGLTSPVSSGPVSTTVGTLLASLQKIDPKKDKEAVREYVALLLGKESLSDVPTTTRCEITSLIDSARQVFFIRSYSHESGASANGSSSGPAGRNSAPLPVIETRELDDVFVSPTPPSVTSVPLQKQPSMRRKSSVSIKKQ